MAVTGLLTLVPEAGLLGCRGLDDACIEQQRNHSGSRLHEAQHEHQDRADSERTAGAGELVALGTGQAERLEDEHQESGDGECRDHGLVPGVFL